MNTKHTDSVEARFNAKFNSHSYDKGQHIEYKAKEIIKFIKAEIKKAQSQQVEKAVRKTEAQTHLSIIDSLQRYAFESGSKAIDIQHLCEVLSSHESLTPNHQD